MATHLEKLNANLEQLIALTGVQLAEEEHARLVQALAQYHQDSSKAKKKADGQLLADFLLETSQDGQATESYRQAARELYARQNAISIGKRIRAARKAIGLNQTEFGKHFNKALRSIQKYESGEIEPSIATINVMSSILGVTPMELLGYHPPAVELKNLGDIAAFLFALSCQREIHFDILPLYDDDQTTTVGSGIAFETKNAEWNSHVVNILRSFGGERYISEMIAQNNPQEGREYLENWLDGMQYHYAPAELTDKLTPTQADPAAQKTVFRGSLPTRIVRGSTTGNGGQK